MSIFLLNTLYTDEDAEKSSKSLHALWENSK